MLIENAEASSFIHSSAHSHVQSELLQVFLLSKDFIFAQLARDSSNDPIKCTDCKSNQKTTLSATIVLLSRTMICFIFAQLARDSFHDQIKCTHGNAIRLGHFSHYGPNL